MEDISFFLDGCGEENTPPPDVKQEMNVKDVKAPDAPYTAVGVTNFQSNETQLFKDSDFSLDVIAFKRQAHCSQDVIISFLNKEMVVQRFASISIAELNLNYLSKLFEHAQLVVLKKKAIKQSVLAYFKKENVTGKRCLVKCCSVLHGLALAEKWRDIVETETKKANNLFSNYQRQDRVAGRRLAENFGEKMRISQYSSFSEIEVGANVSFDIFDKDGFLYYSSEKLTKKHTVFYSSREGNLYFVKERYLNAFGKMVPTKKKPKTLKVKRL